MNETVKLMRSALGWQPFCCGKCGDVTLSVLALRNGFWRVACSNGHAIPAAISGMEFSVTPDDNHPGAMMYGGPQ